MVYRLVYGNTCKNLLDSKVNLSAYCAKNSGKLRYISNINKLRATQF